MSDQAHYRTYELMTLAGDTVTVGRTITLGQRHMAGELLGRCAPHLTYMQRIAVVDAIAFWRGEPGDDELAQAMAEIVCPNPSTAVELLSAMAADHGRPDRD